MSVQLAWLLFAPMMPLRLISIKAGMAWLLVCLSIYLGMGLVDESHWVAAMPQPSEDFQTWTVLQRMMLCMGMLALPDANGIVVTSGNLEAVHALVGLRGNRWTK